MWAREDAGNELDDDAVESKVRSITSLRAADPCNVKCPVEPYGPNNPVPEVSFVCFVLYLLLSNPFALLERVILLTGSFELRQSSSVDGEWTSRRGRVP